MPKTVPVSALKNYLSVLDTVAVGSPVYLTEDGKDRYAIIDIVEREEYEKTKAQLRLMCELEKGKRSGVEKGFIGAADVRAHFEEKRQWHTR